jgi:hypothetical protein
LNLFGDDREYQPTVTYQLHRKTLDGWQDIRQQRRTPLNPLANGTNRIEVPPVTTEELRIIFTTPRSPEKFKVIEIKAFAR